MNIYIFGDGQVEGWTEMKNLLGGKEANLAKMTSTGRSVSSGVGTLNMSGLFQHKFFSSIIISYLHDLWDQNTKYTCPPYRY